MQYYISFLDWFQLIIVLMIVYECSQFLAGLMISSWMPKTVSFILLCAGQQGSLIISLSFSLTCNYFSIVWGFEDCFFFNLFHLFYIYLFCDCVGVHAMVIMWMSERQLMRADSPLPSWGFWGLVPKYYRTPLNMGIRNTSSLCPYHRSKIILLVPFKRHLLQVTDTHMCWSILSPKLSDFLKLL